MRLRSMARLGLAPLLVAVICGAAPAKAADAETAAATSAYAPSGWPTIHADARNSDTSPVVGARSMAWKWNTPLQGLTPAYASIAPDGMVYVTSNASTCTLFALYPNTGGIKWCHKELGPAASASTPLIDRDGYLYVADDDVMGKFDPNTGDPVWLTDIGDHNPVSAQFTPDGNVLLITYTGTVRVLERSSGRSLLTPPVELAPGVVPDHNDCFAGGDGCPVANTPAVDPATGRIVLTFWPPKADAAVVLALRYTGGATPRVVEEWRNPNLTGGSASSPDLSADGTRIYVNNNNNELLVLDARTGNGIGTPHDIGYDAAGSPSTSADGVIIPASGLLTPLLAVHDDGVNPLRRLWTRNDMRQVGVPAQAAGDVGYAFVRPNYGTGPLSLLTFDTRNGQTIDLDDLPNTPATTLGTSIGPRGEVVTPTIAGTIYAFHPA